MKRVLAVFASLCLSTALSISTTHAAAPKEGEEKNQLNYINISPAFVANFGESTTNKLNYVKAEVSLRSMSADADKIKRHMSYVRNELVFLLSKQDMEAMTTNEGKEKLRQEALARVQEVLKQEEGAPLVDDLLFTTFVVQR